MINNGLSSPQIAKKFNVSYPTILKYTEEIIPDYYQKLCENGLRRKSVNKGKKHTEETKQKMRQSKLGNKNPNYGKHTWNKGLTKETDERVKQVSKSVTLAHKRPDVKERHRKAVTEA